MTSDPAIQQNIAWTGVVARDAAVGVQHADVADAADVDDDPRRARRAEGGGVEGRHQRCALAAGGDVAAAEISDDVDARQFGQQRRIVRLAREAEFGPVPHGLTVDSNGCHRSRR
jgi:hypothetical protein